MGGNMDKWLDEYVKQIMKQQVKTNNIFKKVKLDGKNR
jgi:hypothetical protein